MVPKATIYLPDDLAAEAKAADLSLSPVCQRAIREELDRVNAASVVKARESLASYVEEQARWRNMVAEDYPEDDRNAHSAAALTKLAAWVRALPADDARLVRLSGLFIDPISPTEDARRLTSRYGFDRVKVGGGRWVPADPDYWLGHFVGVYATQLEAAEEEERATHLPIDDEEGSSALGNAGGDG